MDFTFTEEQEQLRGALASALRRDYAFTQRQAYVGSETGWSEAFWDQLIEFGITAIPFPDDVGGLDGSIVDLVVVAELFGAHLVSEPWIPSVILAGGVLSKCADQPAARALLEQLAAGETIAALAHEEGRGTPDVELLTTTAQAQGEAYVLTGEKAMVLHGATAEQLVVTARLNGAVALFLVDGPQAAATPFGTIDGRPAANLRFDQTPATLIATQAGGTLQQALDEATIVLAAEAVGAMGALLERTVEYAHTRQQFGTPISDFQAIAHRLADMKMSYTTSRATLVHTAAIAEADQLTAHDVAVLKAQVGRLGRKVGEAAIQVHGGVGMTDELPVGHLHKRILTIDALLGSAEYHLRTLGAPR